MRTGIRPSVRLGALIATRHRRVHHAAPGSSAVRVLLAVLLAMVVGISAVGGIVAMTGIGVVNALAVGLPDPTDLNSLTFAQPTIIYDRTGTVELARFQREERRVVSYDQVPELILDTTTTAEDRTFWKNDGFDPAAILAAVAQNAGATPDTEGLSSERGASTITQQLIRARLLPQEYVADGADRYLRKVVEVIQSARVTGAFPGEEGKEKIITAYLNQIYYGHQAYGVAAAAKVYFGVEDLTELSPAQAALLAGLPKSPSYLDPYLFAVPDAEGRLVVPADSPPVVRRDWVLENLAGAARWTKLTPAELQAALDEPVILAGDQRPTMVAPHFVWQVRKVLEELLGGPEAVETGGFRVITTLDLNAQNLAEKWVAVTTIAPNLERAASDAMLDQLQVDSGDRGWINNMRGKDIHNGAMVALDYRSGDVLAYVGSAGYYRDDLASPKFAPQHDAADSPRQPGSAFKPIVYSAAFEAGKLTPGSVLLDITTKFGKSKGKDWTPQDADLGERGPVLVRDALQQSLNLPAIRAIQRVGNETVADVATKMGIRFMDGKDSLVNAGLAGGIGTVETRPIDLTSAFGVIADGGQRVPPRFILRIIGPDGKDAYTSPAPVAEQVVSPQTAFMMGDILQGNTDLRQNSVWARRLEIKNGPNGEHRWAAVKTGTANEIRDFGTYGFLAPPADPNQVALVVGVWLGNSDHSAPDTSKAPTSLDGPGQIWRAFVRDYSAGWPVAEPAVPDGVVQAKIDRFSGGKPTKQTQKTRIEWFKDGTQPGAQGEIDPAGLLYNDGCVDPAKAELGPESWIPDVEAWLSRARSGTGVKGPYGSKTAYLPGEGSWGGKLCGGEPEPSPEASTDPGNGNGNGGTPPGQETGPAPAPTTAPTKPGRGKHP
ncbi:MAG: transglycosylase domain-containing protein [Chloroflexota bacterium]